MYSFIEKLLSRKASYLVLLAGVALSFQLTACKDTGTVGGDIGGTGSDLTVDTLQVSGLQVDTLRTYTGNLNYLSAGQFQDPLFGNVTATGLIKPALATSNAEALIDDSTNMKLQLIVNKGTVYGDSMASQQFDLMEVNEFWRAPAWKINDEVGFGSSVASFTVANEDTIDVPLSSDWIQKYGDYYNRTDSTRDEDYVKNFYGLALVPQNSNKVVSFNLARSKIIASNLNVSADTSQSDSLTIYPRGWAYGLDRTNDGASESSVNKLYNTREQVLKFDYDFTSDNIEPLNIAKVELLIYRDDLQLEESRNQVGPNAVRPDSSNLHLYYIGGDELPISVDPGSPISVAAYDEDDQAYHFDLTNLVKGGYFDAVSDASMHFYITLGNNDGVIRSTAIFNSDAGEEKAPKLIITSLTNR